MIGNKVTRGVGGLKPKTLLEETWRGAGGQEKSGGRCTGGRRTGEGSGIPKVAGSRRKREKLCNMQYFAMEKMPRGNSQQIQGGNQD